MWTLYCLPGRIVAQLGFLWPGRGQLWASKRRNESGFAHFIYATAFWAVAGLLIAAHFSPPRPSSSTPPAATVAEGASPSEANSASPPDAPAERQAVIPPPTDGAQHQSIGEDEAATSRPITPTVAAPEATPPELMVSDEKVATAIDLTFASGQPERWHSRGQSGYAVAGQPSADGCKLVSIAIDETPDAHPAPVKRCPQ